MEASTIAATLLQSSEVDTVMTTNNQDNVNIQNGFMDPRVLQIDHELPGLDSTEPLSRDESQPLSVSSKAMTTNRKSNLPTGCCYDDRMKLHANADFSASPHHPEDPRRIEAIMTEFKNAGLLYSGDEVQLAEILKDGSHHEWMWRIAARRARIDEITMVHDTEHYEWVRKLSTLSSADLRRMTSDFDNGRKSLYVGNLTYEAALISAGGAIETCKNVVVGNIKNAIAVIRPPGHHAERDESLGFCIFNNVPIAARVCQADYPDICRKVLILDWDVHHGNGIQNIFYEDPNVLYISIHVYQNGIFYPGQPEKEGIPDGDIDKCGKGLGIGKNVNIGWAEQGVGDGEYMAAFQRIVMPIAHEFNPDLVIVSAGFDAAAGDELGGCWVTPACYSHMTHMLMSLAEGKVAVCLEGGYNLRAISKSALAVARTLMGEPPERLPLPPINKTAAQTLDNVIRIQSRYWDCLRAPSVGSEVLKERGAERVSDVVRKHQAIKLNEAFGMIPLYIQRTKLASVFENQVLVSAGLEEAKKILMIIHDPPDFQAFVDGESQQPATYAHNAFITDGTVPYIRWAINDGYAVIDVNIPQSLAEPTDPDPYVPKQTENELQTQTKDLLCYLWDNYLELNPNASISLVGVGDAYLGIKQLLISRESRGRIAAILSFVAGNLRPVKSDMDHTLSMWYKGISSIYVAPNHACWVDPDSVRKVRKARFGTVIQADVEVEQGEDGVRAMLKRYESEGMKFIENGVMKWEKDNLEREDADETASEDELTEEMGVGDAQSGWQGINFVSTAADVEIVMGDKLPGDGDSYQLPFDEGSAPHKRKRSLEMSPANRQVSISGASGL